MHTPTVGRWGQRGVEWGVSWGTARTELGTGGGGGGGQTLTISDHRLPLTAILHLGIQRKGMNESESLEGDTLYSV